MKSPRRHTLCGLVAGAARRGSHLRGDRRGASAILGTMLAFALVVLFVVMVQISAVLAWNQQTESEHLAVAETDFAAFDESVLKAVDGWQTRTTLDAGVDYPTCALFVSPATGSGSPRATDPATARISGAVATGKTGTYQDGSEHASDAQQFAYRPGYWYLQSRPPPVHEGTTQYTAYAGSEVGATQSLVDGIKMSLVFLEGDIDIMMSEVATFDVASPSAGTDYIIVTDVGAPITISVPTRLSEDTWRGLLVDEPSARSIAYAIGTDSNALTVELEPGKTYNLWFSRVGIDTPGALQAPACVVDVEGDNAVVSPDVSHWAVVEVCDAQNNPAPNAAVAASPSLTTESGHTVARDIGTVSTVTDLDDRATLVYAMTGSINGVANDAFDVVVEDVVGATVDRMTFDVQLREGGVTDPLRGLVAAVDDPGSVHADVGGNGEFDGADYRTNDTGTGGDVTYDAGTDRVVVLPSTGTIALDRDITFAGDGVSLHVDTVATGSDSRIDIDTGSGSLAAVGVSVTLVSGQGTTVVAGDETDPSGVSVTQGSKASLSIEVGGDIGLDNAGVAAAQDSNNLRIASTNGFVSARSADISGKGDIRIDGTDGVDPAGAGLSGAKDNNAPDVISARSGVNLNGTVMLGNGDIAVNAEGNVFVVGVNTAPTRTDMVITSDGGTASGREAAISAEGDVVITAAVRIYLPDSSIEGKDMSELNAFEVEV